MAAEGREQAAGPRRGRGRPAQLDFEVITTAARELLDEGGTDALSMRALARRLGVTPMGLYHHVPGKGALLVALLGQEYDREVARPTLPADDREALVEVCMHFHEVLGRHDWALDAIMTGEAYGRGAMWVVEEFLSRVEALGGDDELATALYFACWRLVLGDLMQLRMRRQLAAGGTPWPRTVAAFEEFPRLTAVLPRIERLAAAFDLRGALRALIEGTLPRD